MGCQLQQLQVLAIISRKVRTLVEMMRLPFATS
jgi:hypothetical protein